jgi:hypothetical protein
MMMVAVITTTKMMTMMKSLIQIEKPQPTSDVSPANCCIDNIPFEACVSNSAFYFLSKDLLSIKNSLLSLCSSETRITGQLKSQE